MNICGFVWYKTMSEGSTCVVVLVPVTNDNESTGVHMLCCHLRYLRMGVYVGICGIDSSL